MRLSIIQLATIAVAAPASLVLPEAHAATAVREPGGMIRFYDDNGYDRGYAWCAYRGGRHWGGASDCSYFTYAQCRTAMTIPPGGDCLPNPYASQVAGPPQQQRRR